MVNVLEQVFPDVSAFGKFFRFRVDKRAVYRQQSDSLGIYSLILLGSLQGCWPK